MAKNSSGAVTLVRVYNDMGDEPTVFVFENASEATTFAREVESDHDGLAGVQRVSVQHVQIDSVASALAEIYRES